MMKIYMVMEGVEYEGETVVKVFSSKANAEQFKEELVKEECEFWEENSEEDLLNNLGHYYRIREMEVH